MPVAIPIVKGTVYNKLTIIEEAEPHRHDGKNIKRVKCKCVCGNFVISRWAAVRTGETKSCGCQKVISATKHGLEKHRLYNTYSNMMKRCYNKKNKYYKDYGGRGITVCKEWRSKVDYVGIKNFIAWNDSLPFSKRHKTGLQLDRENNDKGYNPKNCRWVTSKVNNNNRRNSKPKRITP